MCLTEGSKLEGCRILVLEDEHFIASLWAEELEARGAEVVGPVGDLSAGLALAAREPLDAAILDVLVHGGAAYPVAEILSERGIPVVFATGLATELLPTNWRGTKIFEKPFEIDDLVEYIVLLCERPASRAAE
jgi:DNA-binding response OmpR family regulator